MSKTKIWYFIPVILYSLFPWIFGLPFVVLNKTPNLPYHRYLSNIFLLLFSLTTFLIFSISKTKLDTYILPMICPLAILIVTGIENSLTSVHKKFKVLLWFFILIQALLAIACQVLVVCFTDLILLVKLLLFVASLILAYLTFKIIKAYQQHNYTRVINLTIFSVVFFEAMLISPFLNKYINNKQASLKQLAIYLKNQNDPAIFFQGFKPSVQFYYGKPINTFFHGENLTQNLSFKNKYLILLPENKLNDLVEFLPLGYKIAIIQKPYMIISVDHASFKPIPTLSESFSDDNSFKQIISGHTQAGPFTVPYAVGDFFKH